MIRFLTVALIIGVFGLSIARADSDAANVLDRHLSNMQSLSAKFKQQVYAENGRLISQSTGDFELKRPDRLRWQVAEPMPQLIVTDGAKVWIYDKDLEQVIVKELAPTLAETPVSLLTDNNTHILQQFTVKQSRPDYFELLPKSEEYAFAKIALYFKQDTLQQMDLYDKIGQKTVLQFSKVSKNDDIPNSRFQFKVPKGVDVIREDGQ